MYQRTKWIISEIFLPRPCHGAMARTSEFIYIISWISYRIHNLPLSWLGLTYVRYIPKCSKRIQNRRIFSDFVHTFLLLLFYTISIYQNLFRIAAFLMIFNVLLMSLFKSTLFVLFSKAFLESTKKYHHLVSTTQFLKYYWHFNIKVWSYNTCIIKCDKASNVQVFIQFYSNVLIWIRR